MASAHLSPLSAASATQKTLCKAWLFSDTPTGAHASALLYSLVESAKANRLEPSAWLAALLRTVPGAQSVEEIEALLPWNLHPAALPRIATA